MFGYGFVKVKWNIVIQALVRDHNEKKFWWGWQHYVSFLLLMEDIANEL